jgi:ribose transport system substrate-binding protein
LTRSLLVQALQAGEIQGQNPFVMGYDGVETEVDAIQKKPVPARIDTGVTLITPANLNDPEVQALIHPPLDQYLK